MVALIPPGLRLYGDGDLLPPERDSLHSGGLPALVEQLLAAGSAEARHQCVQQALQALGFDWLAYGTLRLHDGGCTPTSFYTPHANPAWMQRYFSSQHHQVDARQRDAIASSLPLVWDLADLLRRAERSRQPLHSLDFCEQLRDCGIGSGVMLSLPVLQHPQERCVISLQSARMTRGWITDAVVGQALVLALSVHEFLSRRPPARDEDGPAHGPAAGMSATQQDILKCLSEGHSDKVIADRLHLSSHAVDYHMRQLRRRFAARNRVQLLHAASDFGGL